LVRTHELEPKLDTCLHGGPGRRILQDLMSLAYRVLGATHYSPQQIESGLAYTIGVDKWMIEDATYYVAEISGQIVGGGGWSKRAKLFGGIR
jgi:hypothetical protein